MWLSYDGGDYEIWGSRPIPEIDREYFINNETGSAVPLCGISEEAHKAFNLPDMEPMTCIELDSITFKVKG